MVIIIIQVIRQEKREREEEQEEKHAYLHIPLLLLSLRTKQFTLTVLLTFYSTITTTDDSQRNESKG